MPEHPYGWLSLLPPVATVVLAVVTRRAIASLLAGVFVGALILTRGDAASAVVATLETHLWPTLIDPYKLRVLGFTLLMGATIGVINRGGGMHGLVQLVTPLASNRRRGQLATWFSGLLIFFDDYTNTLLLGATMRSTCDRLRISREKLAYMVDSTAAPVAGLTLLSTWVAVEIDYLHQGLKAAGSELTGDYTAAGLFLGCLPYRFYMIQALLLVPVIAVLGRDFGPMLRAERAATAAPPPEKSAPSGDDAQQQVSHWTNAVVPLLTTLAVVVLLIVIVGRRACAESGVEPTAQNIFGSADSALALFYGSMVGLGVAIAMAVSRRLLTWDEATDAAYYGCRTVLPALAILWFASALSGMTGNGGEPSNPAAATPAEAYPNSADYFYTGAYLQSLLPSAEDAAASRVVALSLPTVVFLLASVVAFSTGTSFGTMGILIPVVTPIALQVLGSGVNASEPLLMATLGGVLSGAIFGDHCSPISDTTVLSSQSSGCDHVAHVVTQLPYALTAAAVSILFGTALLAIGLSVWLSLPLQTAALVGAVLLFGQPVDEPNDVPNP